MEMSVTLVWYWPRTPLVVKSVTTSGTFRISASIAVLGAALRSIDEPGGRGGRRARRRPRPPPELAHVVVHHEFDLGRFDEEPAAHQDGGDAEEADRAVSQAPGERALVGDFYPVIKARGLR